MSTADGTQGDPSRDGQAERPQPEPQVVRRHLFLDLEDTVIEPVCEGWFNTNVINKDKVRRFIEEWKPDSVHLFSFAIWNEQERLRFNMGTRPKLERALGITLSLVPTVEDDMIPVCEKIMGMSKGVVDFQEMTQFWGKQGAFRLCMQNMFQFTKNHAGVSVEVALLDDVVFNEYFEWPDMRVRGRIINIDQLYKEIPAC